MHAYPASLCLEYSNWFKQAYCRHNTSEEITLIACEGDSPTIGVPELDSCRHT